MRCYNLLIFLASITSIVSASTSTTKATTASPSKSTGSIITKTSTSVQSTPTYFQVIARGSGTKFDGRRLLGTDQSLSNITFGTLPSDDYPSSKIYLGGFNQNPTLKAIDGFQLYAGYNCGDQQLCSYDGAAAFLVFGSSDFTLYEYVAVLCSIAQKNDGKSYLACSAKATDKKVTYRKAVLSNDDGHVLLLPAGVPAPTGFSFVHMEVEKLQGSAPTTLQPCCPN